MPTAAFRPSLFARLALVFAALFTLTACGGSSTKVCNAAAVNSNCCPGGQCPINPGAEYLYAATGTGQVLAMTVDHHTAALGPPSSVPGPAMSLGMAASGSQFVYVSDFLHAVINAYSIDPNSGLLSPVSGSPFSTGSLSVPGGLSSTPGGNFLYAADALQIDGFAIGATGTLSAVPGSPPSPTASLQAVVAPSAKFLFATDQDLPGGILAFTVDSATGSLTAVPGSPFPVPGQTVLNSRPFGIATDPGGNFVFAALNATNQVAAYSVNQTTGALTPVPGSPFSTGLAPTFVATANNSLYVMNSGAQTISAYAIAPTTGILAPVNGSPFAAGASAGMVTDTFESHLYVASPQSNSIVAFTIGADGSLSPLAGSPFPATGAVLLTMVQMPSQGG
jgi:6-phosphogluconolactonase